MVRTCLTASALATLFAALLLPAEAAAGDLPGWVKPVPQPPLPAVNYEPKPGILFVPFEEVTLTPDPCGEGTDSNASKDCSFLVSEETTFPAWGDQTAQEELMTALETVLAPYDVVITNERPADYVNYTMLLMTDTVDDASEAESCGLARANCDGAKRNDIGMVIGGTINCTDPDPVTSALYVFGRLAGLEGTDNTDDPMFFPPDFAAQPTAFQDACATLTVDPSSCSHIHSVYCGDNDTQQNSHQELLAAFGERTEDTEAPIIESIVPEDGDTYTTSDSFLPTATLNENSNAVAVRWTMETPDGDILTKCNNKGLCDDTWNYTTTPVEGPYDFFQIDGPPAGAYVFTFEAQDMYGNEASATANVTVEGGGDGGTDTGDDGGTTGDGGDDGGGGDDGTSTDTGDTGEEDGAADDEDKGCGCSTTSTPTGALATLGLLVLGCSRRRRR